jgi:pyruvate/2-oxoglutarate dehydrogenase complex dihydrolipoamide acyltransferase (E2) component
LVIDGHDRHLSDEDVAVVEELVGAANGHLGTGPGNACVASFDGPRRAMECASRVRDALLANGVDVSIGAHIGEIEPERPRFGGSAEERTAHVRARAQPGDVLVSRTLFDLLAGSGLTLTDAGEHRLPGMDGSWRLYRATTGDAAAPTPPARKPTDRSGVFRREGDVWLLGLGDDAVRIRDSKGLVDIARLLSRPGTEVHVAELVGAGDLGPRPSADPRLDYRAVAEYRARLEQLRSDEDEAQADNDVERASRARAERDALLERLSADVGLGGRPRAADDWVERARKAVRRRVASSLERIDVELPPLGRHLRASIRTGAFCAYEPPEPVSWEL